MHDRAEQRWFYSSSTDKHKIIIVTTEAIIPYIQMDDYLCFTTHKT